MSGPTVAVEPALLSWALERSGTQQGAHDRFPHLAEWLTMQRQPTLTQLDQFAVFTRTPIGYFFLDTPPRDVIPIPDFRTLEDRHVRQPSADLLEVIYECQLRQEWYIDYARDAGYSEVELVGALAEGTDVSAAANAIRAFIDLPAERGSTWAEAFRTMTKCCEDAGFLVMTSGIVGSNTHRPLDPDEFRGFSLVDRVAPLIFINGADTKAANIFTLAHELAHLAIGQGGVDGLQTEDLNASPGTERWCNEVAGELLVPRAALADAFRPAPPLPDELERLARAFKVSTLVILSQLWSARLLDMSWAECQQVWQTEKTRVNARIDTNASGGGNFYKTLPVRVSRRFATALVAATIDGRTPFREAAQLLRVGKTETFKRLSQELGLVA